MAGTDPVGPGRASTLRTAQVVAGALTGGLLVIAAVSELIPTSGGAAFLAAPAALVGVVSLAIGFHVYAAIRERIPRGASAARCHEAFLRATVAGLSVTEGAALFGVVAHVVSGELMPLVGVATHILLVAAIWPSPARLDAFLDAAGAVGPDQHGRES